MALNSVTTVLRRPRHLAVAGAFAIAAAYLALAQVGAFGGSAPDDRSVYSLTGSARHSGWSFGRIGFNISGFGAPHFGFGAPSAPAAAAAKPGLAVTVPQLPTTPLPSQNLLPGLSGLPVDLQHLPNPPAAIPGLPRGPQIPLDDPTSVGSRR